MWRHAVPIVLFVATVPALGGPTVDLLVLTDRAVNSVLRYEGGSGEYIGIFGEAHEQASPLYGPMAMCFGTDGDLLIATSRSTMSAIERYDGDTGAYLGSFAQGGDLIGPTCMAWGPDGNLYVATSRAVGQVLQYEGATGDYLGVFGEANGGDLVGPVAMAYVPEPAALSLLAVGAFVRLRRRL